MNKRRFMTVVITFLIILATFLPVSAAQVQPLVQYQMCEGSYNILSKTQSNKKILSLSMGLWVDPGDSYTVTTEMTQSISNSATFTLIPEFLELGYEVTYSSSWAIGITVTNNLSYMREAALYKIADVFAVTILEYVGNNSCRVTNTTKTVYKGFNYSFK